PSQQRNAIPVLHDVLHNTIRVSGGRTRLANRLEPESPTPAQIPTPRRRLAAKCKHRRAGKSLCDELGGANAERAVSIVAGVSEVGVARIRASLATSQLARRSIVREDINAASAY